MSRQPSPGPSLPHMHASSLYHPPGLANNPQFIQKQKNKNYVAGITAGVEDVKYQAKYKELKKKVKEIEMVSDISAAVRSKYLFAESVRALASLGQ